MMRRKIKLALFALLCGGAPLVTFANCDPYTGYFDFFRDDDADYYYDGGGYYDDYYYDEYYYEEVYYEECWWDCWW